ncbi:hypothetical protein MC885_020883 [Smutsia gigantea]|nr:hypothetical protein MC885_020883 [Smutsia gigantea]
MPGRKRRLLRAVPRRDTAPRKAGKIQSCDPAGPKHSRTPAQRREERIQSREGVEEQACEITSPADLLWEC